ncbi:MAG: YMGG-like glycine zipper-containing protein [Bdellovibrionota bacterium]
MNTKKAALATGLMAMIGSQSPVFAYENWSYARARVLSSEPIYETMEYPISSQVCRYEPVEEVVIESQKRPNAGGAIVGGLLGAVIGSHSRRRKGQNALLGATAGAVIGQSINRKTTTQKRIYQSQEKVCHENVSYRKVEELVGYQVEYEFAGQRYSTEMDQEPGNYIKIRLQVEPVAE